MVDVIFSAKFVEMSPILFVDKFSCINSLIILN